MNGPWYTLEEACEKLSLSHSELRHSIEKHEIVAVANTKKRPFLMHTRRSGAQWIGHAVCWYRGQILLSKDNIASLLDGEPVKLGLGACELLEAEGILAWGIGYPFKKNPPHNPVESWKPKARNELSISATSATPLPTEGTPTILQLRRIAQMLNATAEEMKSKSDSDVSAPLLPLNDPAELALFFDENGTIEPDCLRVASSEISRYEAAENYPEDRQDSAPRLENEEDGKRENQLHTLVLRILDDHPDIKPTAARNIITAEFESDDPRYDRDYILQAVDSRGIEWRSRYHNQSFQQWDSFAGLLRKLKRKRGTEKAE